MAFDPPTSLSLALVALTAAVAAFDLWLLRRAAPAERRPTWTRRGAVAIALWMAAHAALAVSGILEGDRMPPPVMFYLVPTMGIGVAVALSSIGRRLAALPLGLLIGLQVFRVPLEGILHGLYEAGDLPVQMTWSGLNFDVFTGLSGAAVGVLALRRPLPGWALWGWNILGSALLVTVVTIAILSSPTPLRRFMEGPPVILPFRVPFNWIVSVHVWTALVSHLVIFRGLWARRASATAHA